MYDASYKVCRNVRWKDSTINFEENRLETILNTEADLRANEYQQLIFSCFSIIERGKPRDIRACHINDRLVQNALCDNVLIPDLTPKFIVDNCATLKNRGIDYALNRFKKHFQAAHREYGLDNDFFCLRIDIRKYFDSIDHQALKAIAKRTIKDPQICTLCCYLIDTFAFKVTKDKTPIKGKTYYVTKGQRYITADVRSFRSDRKHYEYEEKSLGLGSQTSQLFALLTLNDIDHYIKEKLHIKYYGRYMDDLYLMHNDSQYLAYCQREIEKLLSEIGLSLNKKKTTITRVQTVMENNKRGTPIKYLKWNFYITYTNHIIQKPFKEKLTHQRRKLRKMQKLWLNGKLSTEDLQQSYQGWRAHARKGTCFYDIQDMDNYFRSLFKGVEIK